MTDTVQTIQKVTVPGYDRITIDPEMMGGAPCIRGMRMPVSSVVSLVAGQWSREAILRDFDLEEEDIRQALEYAAEMVRQHKTLIPGADDLKIFSR